MNKKSQIAKAYASAITQISESSNFNLSAEIVKFSEIISSSNYLENLLSLDVFTAEERISVLEEIFKREKFNEVFINFIKFLVSEKRFDLFSMIYKEVIIREDLKMGFINGVIEGSDDQPNEDLISQIKGYLESKVGLKAKLEYKKNSNISAGYKATVGDLQIDATLENQLKKFKEQILNN